MQYGFVHESKNCSGCGACQAACKDKMTVKWARTFAVSHATNMAVLSLKDKDLYLMFTSTISASAAITVPTPNALKIAPLVPCTKMQIQVLSL